MLATCRAPAQCSHSSEACMAVGDVMQNPTSRNRKAAQADSRLPELSPAPEMSQAETLSFLEIPPPRNRTTQTPARYRRRHRLRHAQRFPRLAHYGGHTQHPAEGRSCTMWSAKAACPAVPASTYRARTLEGYTASILAQHLAPGSLPNA